MMAKGWSVLEASLQSTLASGRDKTIKNETRPGRQAKSLSFEKCKSPRSAILWRSRKAKVAPRPVKWPRAQILWEKVNDQLTVGNGCACCHWRRQDFCQEDVQHWIWLDPGVQLCQICYYPYVNAIALNNQLRQVSEQHAKECLQPAMDVWKRFEINHVNRDRAWELSFHGGRTVLSMLRQCLGGQTDTKWGQQMSVHVFPSVWRRFDDPDAETQQLSLLPIKSPPRLFPRSN